MAGFYLPAQSALRAAKREQESFNRARTRRDSPMIDFIATERQTAAPVATRVKRSWSIDTGAVLEMLADIDRACGPDDEARIMRAYDRLIALFDKRGAGEWMRGVVTLHRLSLLTGASNGPST